LAESALLAPETLAPETLAPEVLAPQIVAQPDQDEENAPLTDELLVEEVSIDGMCGVY
jgi:mycofactocin precursor